MSPLHKQPTNHLCAAPVVGVDAHIDPAGCTDFTKIFGESVTSQWADRVVGPYNAASRSS